MATMTNTNRTQEIEISAQLLDDVFAESRRHADPEAIARAEWISRLSRIADADDVARLRASDNTRTQELRAIDC